MPASAWDGATSAWQVADNGSGHELSSRLDTSHFGYQPLTEAPVQYRFDRFVLDVLTGVLSADGEAIALRRRAFDLLRVLLEHAPALVARDQILDEVWGHDALTPNVLPQTIGEIRQALGDNAQSPRLIETVHRRGYRMLVAVERVVDDPAPPVAGGAAVSAQVPVGAESAPMPNDRREPTRPGWRWPLVAVIAVAAISTAVLFWPRQQPATVAADPSRPAIALMIQTDRNAPEWLDAAGTELLSVTLGGDDQVRLLRSDGRSDVPELGDARWQSWLREVLGADYALTGIWRLDGERPALSYSLLRLNDSQVIHGGQASHADLAVVSREVAEDLRRQLQLANTGGERLVGLPGGRAAREAFYRGLAALADGRSGLAVAELERAAADAESGPRVRLALARAYRASGHVGKARVLFDALLDSRDGLTASEQLRLDAEAALANHRPADAASSLLALHRLVRDDAEVAYELVDAQIQARQDAAAQSVLRGLDTLSSEGSRDPRWHLAQAQLAMREFRLDDAAAAAERALALAERYGQDELAARSQLIMVGVDRRRNDPQSAGQRLEKLLAATLTPMQRVTTLLQKGNLLRDTGQFDQAEQVIEEAIALTEELGNDAQQMLARVELHTVKSLRSHSDQTLTDLEALEPRIAVLEDPGLLARYYNTLGVQATLNKQIDKAETYLRRAAAEARKAGQIDNEAGVYINLGNVLNGDGRTDDAIRAWEQALRVFNEIDNGLGAALSLKNLANAAITKGKLELARDQLQQSLDHFQALKAGHQISNTTFLLARVAERQGRLSEAVDLYRQALDAQGGGAVEQVLAATAALARVHLAMAQVDSARTVLAEVEAPLAASSDPGAKAKVHVATGYLGLLTGDAAAARSAFERARALRADSELPDDKVAYSDLDLLTLDLTERRSLAEVRAKAEGLYRQFVRDNDAYGQLMALLIQSRALIEAGRPGRAGPLLEKAEDLLSAYPDAGIAYQLGRARILADAPLEAPGLTRLRELAAEAEAEGFVTLALRTRLDAAPTDAELVSQIRSLQLAGILSPKPE